MHANATNAISLKKILDDYCSALGQLVSEAKSSIYFSPNTKVDEGGSVSDSKYNDAVLVG